MAFFRGGGTDGKVWFFLSFASAGQWPDH